MRADVDAVLFDKDGTLFLFGATWEAWAQAFLLRACDGDVARARAAGAVIGFDLEAHRFAPDSIVIAGTPDDIISVLAPLFPEKTPGALLRLINAEAATAPQAEAVPLAPLLDRLKSAGLRLGVATNDAEYPALAHLESAGVRDRFDFVAGSDSGHGGKPAPGQLLAFCAHFGLEPARVVMVGDSLHDLHAGRAAGMRCVAVLTGVAKADSLRPFCDVVLPDIGHLPDWLGLSQAVPG